MGTQPFQTSAGMLIKIFLITLATVLPCMGQTSSLNWAEYISTKGKFSILFPGRPDTGYRPIGADSETSVTYVTNLILDEKAWAVAYFDLSAQPADEAAVQKLFDRTRDHMLKMYSVQLAQEENLTMDGQPVRALRTKLDDQSRVQHTRIYLIGKRVYQVWALARVGNEQRDGVAKYFDSFKATPLNEQESKAALANSQNDVNKAVPRKIKVSSDVLLENAITKVKPVVPSGVRAKGVVELSLVISIDGDVVGAETISGHALLRNAAIEAIRQWKFKPMMLGNTKVMTEGVLQLQFK
jgi:hypothetical protein